MKLPHTLCRGWHTCTWDGASDWSLCWAVTMVVRFHLHTQLSQPDRFCMWFFFCMWAILTEKWPPPQVSNVEEEEFLRPFLMTIRRGSLVQLQWDREEERLDDHLWKPECPSECISISDSSELISLVHHALARELQASKPYPASHNKIAGKSRLLRLSSVRIALNGGVSANSRAAPVLA